VPNLISRFATFPSLQASLSEQPLDAAAVDALPRPEKLALMLHLHRLAASLPALTTTTTTTTTAAGTAI
jgi:hypothetical protein